MAGPAVNDAAGVAAAPDWTTPGHTRGHLCFWDMAGGITGYVLGASRLQAPRTPGA
jgi:hypothetical protein